MAEVRSAVDSLDRELVALLAERFRLMAAAARIKQTRAEIRDEPRKREVVENAARHAVAHGLPAEIMARLWDALVEESIAYELERFDRDGSASGAERA